jgi:hypothetical protein
MNNLEKAKQAMHTPNPTNAVVNIVGGYHGSAKIQVYINNKELRMDIDEVEVLLSEMIETKGYQINKTNRQHYPRITINK